MAATEGVKELYMAASMEELNKKMSTANIDCSSPKLLGRSSSALFLAAKDAALQKDEEKAYVLFMRFMELVKKIRASKEYKTRKAEYDKMVPGHKIKTALTEAERLSTSLRERYAAPQGKRQKLDSEQPQGEGVVDQQVPDDATEGNNMPLSAEQLYKRNSTTALVPQQPLTTSRAGDITASTGPQSPAIPSTSISAQDLFSLIKSSPDDVIVLDCRPRSMFLTSHPDGKKYPQWLSVPEEMIKNGITCDSIAQFLRGNSRKMWADRATKLAIVLVDCATTSSELSSSSVGLPMVQLRDVIHKYDTAVELPRPPVILEGGYTQWYLHYSPVCVGSWRWEGKGRGRGEGGGGGGGEEELINGGGSSLDYPTFPEISDDVDDPVLEEPTTPMPVATTEAIQDPSNSHTHFAQPQATTQVVPLAPSSNPNPHVLTNHTPLLHPPPQVLTPIYEPPPVMTILSLDDPSLNQDDPTVQLSTMSENRVNQFGNVPPGVVAPHMHYQAHNDYGQPTSQFVQPVLQSAQSNFVAGQEGLSHIHQDPQVEQQHWQTGQAHQQSEQPTYVQTQAGQVNPQNEQTTRFHQQPEYTYPQSGPPATFVSQPNEQAVQQVTQYLHPQTEQMVHPANVQMGYPQQPPAHTGQPHPPIVQQAPHPEHPVVTTGQSHSQESVIHPANPQMGYPQQPPAHTGQPHPPIVQQAPHPEHPVVTTGQSHSQESVMHPANPQMGYPQQPPAHTGQPHPPIVQQAPYPEHPVVTTGQSHSQESVMHPANPQMGYPQQPPAHTGQPHPPIVQQAPYPEHPVVTTGQSHSQGSVMHPANPQMGYPQQPPAHTGQPHPPIVQQAPYPEHPVETTGQSHSQESVMHPSQLPVSQNSVQSPDSVPNQRVAYGPIPDPPGYDQALQLPSQPPVQPPIPPPVSLPPAQSHNQTGHYPVQNQFHDQQQQNVQYSSQASQISNSADHYSTGQPPQNHMSSTQYQDGMQQNLAQTQFQNPDQPAFTQQPPQPNPQVQIDPNLAKIRELEEQLQQKEEEEKARREAGEREKAALEQEKQKWKENKKREHQELERKKQALAQEKAEFERMRLQVEEERRKSAKDSEQLRQLLQVQQSGQKDQRTFAVNQGLPAGWEKRLDRTTGRFYYIDHNSKTTHWNPPGNWLEYQAQLQRRMQEQQGVQKPGVPGQISTPTPVVPRGQMTQLPPQPQANPVRVVPHDTQAKGVPAQNSSVPQAPQSSENQPTPPTVIDTVHPSQPQVGQTVVKPAVPSVDRSKKPQTPSVDRSTKPTMNPAVHKKKINDLQPMYGSQGYGLTGLRNLGNTCFMNSTLQCLCATSPFVTHFLRGTYLKDRNRSNPLGHGGVLADEFSFLMKAMWSGQYRFISPRDFKDTISRFAPTFSGTKQHDSQEFLAFLLDGLHEDMNRVVERRYIQNPDYTKYDDREAATIAWSLHKKRNDSIIVDLFQGQFRSTLRCLTCQQRSVNFEAFMYLSVPLPHGNDPCTLKECIKLFTKEEHVSGNDKWFCSSCKQHRDASKRIEIWKLPAILLIHLKRFSYDGVWRQKKQNFVDFPFSGLDMSSDVVGARDGLQNYKLFGVSNHFGTLSGGHYTAFCLNPYKQRFYNFDDQEIKEVSQRQVKSSAAYLLFYTSMDLSPPKVL